jgi:aryl-alcohol dehydrogenase-like predicted oxidoreductase
MPAPTSLPLRTLGSTLTVSCLGFGAMGMSEFYGPSDDAASTALLGELAERGVTLIDTADNYGMGHNETLIGAWLRASGRAGQMKIATKCGIERSPAVGRRINNTPAYIRRCCDASLSRLGIEQIDLYYLHRVDPAIAIEESMGTMADLVKEGKIAHVGLCEVSAGTLERAHRVHPVTALQTEYSLWTRDVENGILAATKALGVGFVAYSPLGRGFLSGRLDPAKLAENDFRRTNPRFEGDNLQANLGLLETVRAIAAQHAATPALGALAWLLAQGEHIVPIPGTRRSSYLQENLGALEVRLTAADLAQLDLATAPGKVHGTRYDAAGMKTLNV